ncbi:MAG: DEAD/DEAH box helicase [Kiritimatiellae bacterium]|nr:DEAD/DEAH box helicase [Kiritimatiellia bacterium]
MFEGSVFGRLDQKLQHAIADAGYETPTPIQAEAMPYLFEGRDFIGCAQTGTGKTAAFMLPILDHLLKERRPRHIGHPRALVLSPTRELAAQTAENVRKFSKYANLPFACVFGGVSQFGQVKDIKKGAETVIACPGRLIDLMTQGILYLDRVECFVLDEADRMLDMGFLPDIRRIISKLPKSRQSLFFSATMSNPIRSLAGELVTNPAQVTIASEAPTVEKINQKVMMVEKAQKDALLLHLLESHQEWTKVIVFTKMRHGADRVCKKLFKAGVSCAAIHSDKTQNQRTRALEGFRRGQTRVLVATDIASRGIDVPDVSCVVNMELPLETESYVHRIGRTARAGESGAAISFVTGEERAQLKAVERFIKKTIRVDRDQPFHSEFADRKAGKSGEGLPTAPWVHPANRNKTNRKRQGHKSFLGRRQPDFNQKKRNKGE